MRIAPWTTTTSCVCTDLELVVLLWFKAVDDNPRVRRISGPVIDVVVFHVIQHLIQNNDTIAMPPRRWIPLQSYA